MEWSGEYGYNFYHFYLKYYWLLIYVFQIWGSFPLKLIINWGNLVNYTFLSKVEAFIFSIQSLQNWETLSLCLFSWKYSYLNELNKNLYSQLKILLILSWFWLKCPIWRINNQIWSNSYKELKWTLWNHKAPWKKQT